MPVHALVRTSMAQKVSYFQRVRQETKSRRQQSVLQVGLLIAASGVVLFVAAMVLFDENLCLIASQAAAAVVISTGLFGITTVDYRFVETSLQTRRSLTTVLFGGKLLTIKLCFLLNLYHVLHDQ